MVPTRIVPQHNMTCACNMHMHMHMHMFGSGGCVAAPGRVCAVRANCRSSSSPPAPCKGVARSHGTGRSPRRQSRPTHHPRSGHAGVTTATPVAHASQLAARRHRYTGRPLWRRLDCLTDRELARADRPSTACAVQLRSSVFRSFRGRIKSGNGHITKYLVLTSY